MAKKRSAGTKSTMGKARKPAKRIRRAEQEGELDVFERRLEWFRELHTDRQGLVPPFGRQQAIEHAKRLGRVRLRRRDPGGQVSDRGFELVATRKTTGMRLRKATNPRPKSSFGFAGDPVEVVSEDSVRGTTIKIALDREKLAALDPATVRIFRFDSGTGEWQLIARSGASLAGDYAWAELTQPGVYVPIGLPTDPWLLRTIMVVQTYLPWLRAAKDLKALDKILDPICRVILCSDTFDKVRKDPALADKFGLPPFEGKNAGDICELCLGLDLPFAGLPEGRILEDPGVILEIPPKILWPFYCKTWVSNGPTNFSGRIKSLALHPTNGNILYAGGADGGVWKTTDGGVSWFSTMKLELSMAIGALGISQSSPNVLYAATGEDVPGWGPSYPGVGVYKTTDGGGDWDLMGPIASTRCSRVMVHPTNPDIVYVSGNGGLHKSTNGGATWTNIRTDHVSDVLLDPLTPTTLYAGVWNNGVYKSTDSGTTWTQLTSGLPTGSAAEWIKLAMGLNGTDGTAFLVAKMGTDSGQLYKSNDAGATWTAIAGTHGAVSYNEWTNLVAVDPNNQNVIFAGAVGLERTSNGGTSFSAIGGTHSDHHAIVFRTSGSSLCYMSTDGGVYKSTDNGVTWTLASPGLIATQLYSIGVAQTSPFVMGGASQDQGILSSSGSATWTNTGAGNEGGFFIVDPNNSSNIYVTPWSANLRRSTNGGVSWTTILTGLGSPAIGVAHLAVKTGDSNLLLCCGASQVFRSTNKGTNWTSVLTTSGGATRVAFSKSAVSVCYAATSTGRVYRSSGSGATGSWAEPYTAANKPPTGYISGIGISAADPDLLYIAYAGYGVGHVYRSTDGGAHWSNASGVLASDALPDIPVSAIVVDQYNPEVVYVSTDIGVFRTRDGGDSWEPFDDGLPRIVVSEIVLHTSDNTLYVSTMGRGAFRRVL
ncbi:MAG TPA: hypothetical protein VJN96_20120 [Vicinamibacterales bacterium]|nr:hypothetical protein [Vicinamibacterales bacterium]